MVSYVFISRCDYLCGYVMYPLTKTLNELFKQVKRQQFLWREITWLGIYHLKKKYF